MGRTTTTITTRYLIRKLGGAAHVARRLQKRGHHISDRAIQKWVERRRVGTLEWMVELAILAREDGWVLDVSLYAPGAEEPDHKPRPWGPQHENRREDSPAGLLD